MIQRNLLTGKECVLKKFANTGVIRLFRYKWEIPIQVTTNLDEDKHVYWMHKDGHSGRTFS